MTLLLALAAALAQPAPAPVLSAEGRVTDASPRGEHDIAYAEHRLRLVAGTRYRAIVTAPPQGGFLSRIEIRQGQPIAESNSLPIVDEGERIPDERLDFVAPRTGDYRLRVYALGYEPRGAYAVRVVALPPLPAPRPEPAAATQTGHWQSWRGAIDESDPEAVLGHHDDYPLEMRAGETWLATVSPEGGGRAAGEDGPRFTLRIMSADDPDGFGLATEDPIGDENAAIAFQPPRDGVYIVRIEGGNSGGAPAPYRLDVTRLPTAD